MKPKLIFYLLTILALGFLIRVYKTWEMPMYGDELTIVYDSYSILKTGTDVTGKSFPITFSMGEGRQGGYIYGSIPFVYLFGPSELGVRSLSVLSGIGMIILMYFLGKKIFNEKVGLIASFLTSISMWDIYLSRGGFEAHFALFLATLGVTAFLYEKYIIWAVTWGIATLTYPTFKLTLPLIFLILLFFKKIKNDVKNKLFWISIIILSIFSLVVLHEALKSGSEARFAKINILSSSDIREMVTQNVNSERHLSTLPDYLKPFFYNKFLIYSRIILDNYTENLSPKFLYLRGDGNPRHNPGEFGMFYFVDFVLFVTGLYFLTKEQKREVVFLGFWILIIPLATMLLGQTHALRNAFLLPPFLLIFAYALSKLSKRFFYIFTFLMFLQLIFVLNRVYFLAPNKFANFWSAKAKEESILAMKSTSYELSTKIDNIEFAYPVYAQIDPKEVISQYGKFPKVYGNVRIVNK